MGLAGNRLRVRARTNSTYLRKVSSLPEWIPDMSINNWYWTCYALNEAACYLEVMSINGQLRRLAQSL